MACSPNSLGRSRSQSGSDVKCLGKNGRKEGGKVGGRDSWKNRKREEEKNERREEGKGGEKEGRGEVAFINFLPPQDIVHEAR